MTAKKLRLRIVTPEQVMTDGDADMVIMRCTTGDMGILPGHEACSAALDDGTLRVLDGGGERRVAVHGGVATIQNDVLTILTNAAEWADEA